jgi:hypothetical protein
MESEVYGFLPFVALTAAIQNLSHPFISLTSQVGVKPRLTFAMLRVQAAESRFP